MAKRKTKKPKEKLQGVERLFGKMKTRDKRRAHGFIYKKGFEHYNPKIHAVNPKLAKERRKELADDEKRESFVEEIEDMLGLDDLEDYEREEVFNDLVIHDMGFDLDEFVDMMEAEGYSEHDAYEIWFYP